MKLFIYLFYLFILIIFNYLFIYLFIIYFFILNIFFSYIYIYFTRIVSIVELLHGSLCDGWLISFQWGGEVSAGENIEEDGVAGEPATLMSAVKVYVCASLTVHKPARRSRSSAGGLERDKARKQRPNRSRNTARRQAATSSAGNSN